MSSRLFSLSRLTTFTTTTVLRRALSTTTTAASSAAFVAASSNATRFSLLRTISAVGRPTAAAVAPSSRTFCTQQAQTSMNDGSPNWSNRPPKETILLDGCDFEHWLIVTDPPPQDWTRDQIIDYFAETLATVVGSVEEARMKLYSVSTRHYFGFGALISEEQANKLREREDVRWSLPDSYLDVRNKDYGGEPVIEGRAVPYDPKYHEEWVRNNQKAQERNSRNDRPRNSDRSRNFERRQNTGGPPPPGGYQQQNMPPRNPGYQPNMGGAPPNAGYQQNMPPPNNAGYPPRNNPAPPPNAGYQQNMPPPNNTGYPPRNNPAPYNNAAPGYQNRPPNAGYQQNAPPPQGGMSGNYGGQQNPGYGNNTAPNYQSGGPQNYAPNTGYPSQNVPGRD